MDNLDEIINYGGGSKDKPQAFWIQGKSRDDAYFTPSIEDIRVGYEVEVMFGNKWVFDRCADFTSFITVKDMIAKKQIRVPYLTKEQIEAEGWKEIIANLGGQYEKGNFKMLYGTIKSGERVQKYLSIVQGELCRYAGECKDINTFRYICKLLGI